MVFLAARYGDTPTPLPEIAASEGIPAAFLERILAKLRDAGLVRATRGVSGGYQLARAPQEIAAGEVVAAIEGPLALVGCLPDQGGCERSRSCASRAVWRKLDAAITDALNGITLDDLTREACSA